MLQYKKGYDMKIEQATQPLANYPTRKSLTPILLSVGVAMTLTACTPSAGKMPVKETPQKHPVKESNTNENIEEAPIAGGLPIYIPPIEEENRTVKVKDNR